MEESVKDQLYGEKFRQSLEKGMSFPGEYPFKFIVRTDTDARAQIEKAFEGSAATVTETPSSKGNYVSLTIVLKASSADDILEKYKATADIPGVIRLLPSTRTAVPEAVTISMLPRSPTVS